MSRGRELWKVSEKCPDYRGAVPRDPRLYTFCTNGKTSHHYAMENQKRRETRPLGDQFFLANKAATFPQSKSLQFDFWQIIIDMVFMALERSH